MMLHMNHHTRPSNINKFQLPISLNSLILLFVCFITMICQIVTVTLSSSRVPYAQSWWILDMWVPFRQYFFHVCNHHYIFARCYGFLKDASNLTSHTSVLLFVATWHIPYYHRRMDWISLVIHPISRVVLNKSIYSPRWTAFSWRILFIRSYWFECQIFAFCLSLLVKTVHHEKVEFRLCRRTCVTCWAAGAFYKYWVLMSTPKPV